MQQAKRRRDDDGGITFLCISCTSTNALVKVIRRENGAILKEFSSNSLKYRRAISRDNVRKREPFGPSEGPLPYHISGAWMNWNYFFKVYKTFRSATLQLRNLACIQDCPNIYVWSINGFVRGTMQVVKNLVSSVTDNRFMLLLLAVCGLCLLSFVLGFQPRGNHCRLNKIL